VLVERLKAALRKFNCKLPPEAIQTAVDELTRDRSAMSLEAANREVYRLLKDGIRCQFPTATRRPEWRPMHRTPARGRLGTPGEQ
jgi:type I site-specific restriction-modification system R (restriction) subunit